MTEAHGRRIKRSVRIARKSAKFLLSPVEIVRFTAESATQSEKIAVVKRDTHAGTKNITRVAKSKSEEPSLTGFFCPGEKSKFYPR